METLTFKNAYQKTDLCMMHIYKLLICSFLANLLILPTQTKNFPYSFLERNIKSKVRVEDFVKKLSP